MHVNTLMVQSSLQQRRLFNSYIWLNFEEDD
jgi:hypothetical protein